MNVYCYGLKLWEWLVLEKTKSTNYVKVLLGDEYLYEDGTYKYKIWEVNVADNWEAKSKEKINKDNVVSSIKEYESYYKGYTEKEIENYNMILNILKALRN